jgi:cobalt-zinc-cadmium efflux system outer membrane protein
MDLDVGYAQLFETGGQRAARIAGAEAGIARETAAADDAKRLALRSVAFAYLRTLYAQERIALLRGSETIAADVMTVAERRNAAGDIAILDVNIAKIALARARAARSAAEAERTVFAGELQRLLGIPSGNRVVAAGSLRLQRQPELANLLAAAGNRPDLRAMEADIRDAEADVRLGRATSRPDIGLGARVKREEGHKAVLGELTFTLPFFNQGQELRTTGTARVSRVRLELETTRASIESEVRSLFEAFAARQAALGTFEQDAMPRMDENDALARRSFEVGQISLPELLLVRRELVETRLEYLNRLLEVAEAAIEQDAAAGVLQ